MSRPITILRQPISELSQTYPNLARHLRGLGCVGIVTLVSGVPAAMCYEREDGSIEYVSGSRSLADRYDRECLAS